MGRRCGRSLCHASYDVAVASYADHADAGDSERKGILRQEIYKSLIATKKVNIKRSVDVLISSQLEIRRIFEAQTVVWVVCRDLHSFPLGC